MRTIWTLLIGALLLACLVGAYLLYPYWTLQRIEAAVRRSDVATMESLIDWERVRAGMKSDVRAQALGGRNLDLSSGYGMLGAAVGAYAVDAMIDALVTPAGLARVVREKGEEGQAFTLGDRVRAVRFVTPTEFVVDIAPPDHVGDRVSLKMELGGLSWRITRVIVPPSVFERQPAEGLPSNAPRTRPGGITPFYQPR